MENEIFLLTFICLIIFDNFSGQILQFSSKKYKFENHTNILC